jgi:hypothetical protein
VTIFFLLALAAFVVLLVIEWAWAARLPPHRIKRLLLRSVSLAAAAIVVSMVLIGKWHWLVLPAAVPLAFGHQIAAWLARGRAGTAVQQAMRNARILHESRARAARERARKREQTRARARTATAPSPDMTEAAALRILGLKPGATPNDIKKAHRRLIRKVHPDRGGSSHAAAQINRAKDYLLED